MAKITPEIRLEIVRLFKTSKYSLLEIAKEVGVSVASVSNVLTNYLRKK